MHEELGPFALTLRLLDWPTGTLKSEVMEEKKHVCSDHGEEPLETLRPWPSSCPAARTPNVGRLQLQCTKWLTGRKYTGKLRNISVGLIIFLFSLRSGHTTCTRVFFSLHLFYLP